MVRNKPVKAGTAYAGFKYQDGARCMLCGRYISQHYRPCWKAVEPVRTTATTTEEAKERSRRILEND